MEGVLLKDVYVIPRNALRGVNRIYLIDKESPAIQRATIEPIEPIWSTAEVLVVRDGLRPGDWVATSRLPYAPNGAPVEVIEPPVAAEKPAEQEVASGS